MRNNVVRDDMIRFEFSLLRTTTQVAAESQEPREVILEEATGILDEMAQNLKLHSVRLLGFVMNKVFQSVFRSIYVNEEGLARVSHAILSPTLILKFSFQVVQKLLLLSTEEDQIYVRMSF